MEGYTENLHDFFNCYPIARANWEKAGYTWEELIEIRKDYVSRHDDYRIAANAMVDALRGIDGVHTVRSRVKNPDHLLEKVIRKTAYDPTDRYSLDNYKDKITDLAGVRALHLFKNEWLIIHKFIIEKCNLKEGQDPIAYIKKGDPEDIVKLFAGNGCKVIQHKYGYRSIHYVINNGTYKYRIYVEIQVRTIFEEAWSEIDHTIRYPYDIDNPVLKPFLYLFSIYAGAADGMGTYICHLKDMHDNQEKEYLSKFEKLNGELEKKEQLIVTLINNLNITENERDNLKKELEKYTKMQHFQLNFDSFGKQLAAMKLAAMEKQDEINHSISGQLTANDLGVFENVPILATCSKCGKDFYQKSGSILGTTMCLECSAKLWAPKGTF